MEYIFLLEKTAQRDGYGLWLSMVLCAIGMLVILIKNKKKK